MSTLLLNKGNNRLDVGLLPTVEFPGEGWTIVDDIFSHPRGDGLPYSIKVWVTPDTPLIKSIYANYDSGKPWYDVVRAIWEVVLVRIAYATDEETKGIPEYFRYPEETWNEKVGDCEDGSFLLTSLLLNGFKTYTAVGNLVYGSYAWLHAWVVVRTEGGDYLLESTLDSLPPVLWRTVKQMSSMYQPFWYWNNAIIFMKSTGGKISARGETEEGKREALEEIWM